jgi:hypothetical protein
MVTAEEVARTLLDNTVPINQRIHMALIASEVQDTSVRAALEIVARSQEQELIPYACTALVQFWLRDGVPDRNLFNMLSYEGQLAVKQALLHEAPQWLAKV